MIRRSQHGNAIFMILIAVSLFAALGYVFANSSRTSSSFLTDEEAKAYASQIIAYGNEVRQAVKRLQLRGCSDTEVSFENNVVAGYENPNAPTDKSCHVFDGNGGGVNWFNTAGNAFDKQWETSNPYYSVPFYLADFQIAGVGEDCADSSCSELTFMLSDLSMDVCNEINNNLNIVPPAPDSMTNYNPISVLPTKYIGNYTYVNVGSVLGNRMTELNNKKSGCFLNDPTSSILVPTFYQVLIAR